MFLLDTNILIDILRHPHSAALRHLVRLNPDIVAISSITLAELEYGVHKSSDPAGNAQRLIEALSPLTVLPFDSQAAGYYGMLRCQLESKGLGIGPLDTLIAAHALSLKAVLVTSNEREFRRVSSLRVVNWLKKAAPEKRGVRKKNDGA